MCVSVKNGVNGLVVKQTVRELEQGPVEVEMNVLKVDMMKSHVMMGFAIQVFMRRNIHSGFQNISACTKKQCC